MNTISVIELMPSTKEELETFIAKLKPEIINGDPISAAVQIKAIEELLKRLRADKDIREAVISELEKHADGKTTAGGNKLELCETGIKYHYNGDSELNDLLAQEKELKEKIKARQKLLQGLDKSYFDTDTGEEILPAWRESTTNYKITLK